MRHFRPGKSIYHPVLLLGLLLLILPARTAGAQGGDLFLWDELFTYHNPLDLLAEREDGDIVLMATGDVMLARTINERMVNSGDFTFPFASIGSYLSRADITWVNLETPLMPDCPVKRFGMIFCANARAAEGLSAAGIDVANLANNHTENYGEQGVIDTQQVLDEVDIQATGVFKPVIFEMNGKKIGLVCFNNASIVTWVTSANRYVVQQQIEELRPQVDYLIACFHWGVEYTLRQNPRQRNLARLAIDSGADMVIGHHPHWLQGIELYKGKRIVYSLGNFIFDQNEGGWLDYGAIAVLRFRARDGGIQLNLVPIVIEDKSTPRLATPTEADMILERIASVSQNIGDK